MAEDEETGNGDVAPRAFWSGTITFGLVSIPVELYPANRSQRVSLRMVSEDGVPLQRRYFCSKDGRELDWDDIVRGYEVEKGKFVVVDDEELERIAPEKTRDIDLRRFVTASEIDPIYFERAYFLTPGGNSTKAYRLLAATMEQTDRAGIATFVMRGKEYLVAILAENGVLRAETLRFADEVRSAADVGLPEPVKPPAAAVTRIEKAIRKLEEKDLDEAELEDASAGRLLELVARKEKAGEDVYQPPAGADSPSSDGIIDLMEVLKRSLQGKGDSAAAPRQRSTRAATKRSGTTAAGKTVTKSAAKKSGAKKAAGKKSGAKKSSAKKAAGKKSSAKKRAARTAGRKTAEKKSTARKAG